MTKTVKKVVVNLNGVGTQFDLFKIAEINLSSDREFIYFEKKNGTWILNYTAKTIPEIKNLKSIDIVRESGENDA